MRERERKKEKEQQGGWDNYTLFVHPGIRIQNAGVTAKRMSADAVFNENKEKNPPYLLLSDRLLFYSITINCTTEQRLLFTYICVYI